MAGRTRGTRRDHAGRWRVALVACLAVVTVGGCTTVDPGVHSLRSTAAGGGEARTLVDDPAVTRGRLANGLTYYVRENDRPGAQVQLRLVVDAGSALEEPDQSGVAHFLEHMMFNGTAHYPKNELIDVLKGFGAAFGADINAYTSYDETVYELTVPNDSDAIDAALDVLHEWLTAATLTDDDVTAERGVVLDEWRQRGQSSSGRSLDAADHLLLDGTPYEGRAPIGSDAAISAMEPEVLRRFYDRWYRPENAAIVVVGDIDVDDMEEQIAEVFDGVTSRDPSPFERPVVTWTGPAAPVAAVHLDPDVTTVDVEVVLPEPDEQSAQRIPVTTADIRRSIETHLAFDIIATRIADDIRRGELTLVGASSSSADFVRSMDAPSVYVSASPDHAAISVQVLLDEFERLARHGIGDNELARAKGAVRARVTTEYDQRTTIDDIEFADRYVQDFLRAGGYPDADSEFAVVSAILDDITPRSVAAVFAARWTDAPAHVLVTAPQSAGGIPSSDDVLALVDGLAARDLPPRGDSAVVDTDEFVDRPAPVREARRSEIDGDGYFITPTVLTFPNGAEVVLNVTDIVDDNVHIHASSAGGISQVGDADVPSARLATQVVPFSGLGDLDAVQVDQLLSTTGITVAPYLLPEEEAFYGDTPTADLEDALAYIHQLMTAWRVDPTALDIALDSERTYAAGLDVDADLAGQVALDVARYGDSARYRTQLRADELDQVSADGIDAVWRARFGNPNGWRFVLSGDFDVNVATDLARAYIGSLPDGGATESFRDLEPHPPTGPVREELHVGTGDRASITQMFTVERAITASDAVLADVLTSVIDARLIETVREEMGASYSPTSYVYTVTVPRTSIVVYVSVTGAPDRMAEVERVLAAQLAGLAANGPTTKELDNATTEVRRQYGFISNEAIAAALIAHVHDPGAVDDYVRRSTVLEMLTADEVARFARELLDPAASIEVVVLPA